MKRKDYDSQGADQILYPLNGPDSFGLALNPFWAFLISKELDFPYPFLIGHCLLNVIHANGHYVATFAYCGVSSEEVWLNKTTKPKMFSQAVK